jgi:hypothetical protein
MAASTARRCRHGALLIACVVAAMLPVAMVRATGEAAASEAAAEGDSLCPLPDLKDDLSMREFLGRNTSIRSVNINFFNNDNVENP